MKIVVCVKQVPDPDAALSITSDRSWIVESGVNFQINDYDRYALEEALRLKDSAGAEVVALTLGPERAAQALKTCLATGADRAVHLRDEAFLGGDPWGTAVALAAAARAEAPDLVLCGLQADDDNLAQTPVLMAEILGLPHATAVMKIELRDTGLRIERELEGDRREVLDLPLPALLTVQTGINEPRYASIKGIMAAKKKELKSPSPADLGLDSARLGRPGARLTLSNLAPPPRKEAAELLSGPPDQVAAEIVRRIRESTGLI